MSKNNVIKSEERRQFFRVEDEVNLVYVKIDEKNVIEGSYVSENILGNWPLSAALEMVAQESALLLHKVGKSNPDVADYLRLIDNKIELLAQAMVMQSGQFNQNNVRNANLSATGIAFESEDAFQEGDYLEIKILLVNSMAVIIALGKVVYCKNHEPGAGRYPNTIGVDYVSIKDQDRELLIKHVVKRQLQQIRDSKENKP
ncbi:MAG: PilZ domain-containing protein [Methylococcaceae bacterium]|nr:PilZ domain-containing protein [Methylococcaceae bacterium]